MRRFDLGMRVIWLFSRKSELRGWKYKLHA
jgi:hypothetical protein